MALDRAVHCLWRHDLCRGSISDDSLLHPWRSPQPDTGLSDVLADHQRQVSALAWVVANAAVGMKAPDITNAVWLNSAPLHLPDLKGKVVMVEFWTFGCYNCRNVEPYVKQWHHKYADRGLVVIGVHSPEFTYEHDLEKVKRYLTDHDIRFPVPIDNDFST